MKSLSPISPVLALVLLPLLAVTGCKKEQTPPTEPKTSTPAVAPSAERTSFAQVTSKLDAGGDLYLYLSTEQCLAGVSAKVGAWHGLLDAIPNVKPEDRQNLDSVFAIVTNLIQQSGIEDVSGVGMSSIARETNFYHSKLVLHHYPGKGAGFLWNLCGQKPHALDGLNLLPASTALATFSDLDAPLLWSPSRNKSPNPASRKPTNCSTSSPRASSRPPASSGTASSPRSAASLASLSCSTTPRSSPSPSRWRRPPPNPRARPAHRGEGQGRHHL